MATVEKRLRDLEDRVRALEEFSGRASYVVNMHTPIGPRKDKPLYPSRTAIENLKMKIRVREIPKKRRKQGGGG